ncbi:protein of unknown function [Candidatus Nitrospira inopinata]|uniref:Uncharacterized protein n=1 Tax=Candidatus Nitrospira inopinata TaxID=1715989 RepID=A0A0S4KTK1_9BACT|nr:protein of unknown function [Candidatus Nitrospira inopinata]
MSFHCANKQVLTEVSPVLSRPQEGELVKPQDLVLAQALAPLQVVYYDLETLLPS